MNIMKKIKVIVALTLIMSMITIGTVLKINAAETPTFAFNSSSANAGGEVELTLTCSNNPGINGWAVNIGYDSSVMQIVSTDKASAFGEVTVSQNLSENPFRIQWFGLSDVTTNGKMAGLTFKIDENAKSGDYIVSISYSEDEVVNLDEDSVHFDTIDATVSVNGKSEPDTVHTHNLTKIESKVSTCLEQGNNEYFYCEDCGKYFKDTEATTETTVEAEKLTLANHNFIENAKDEYLKSEATCTSQAVYYKSCSVCGEKSNETFIYGELKSHDYSDEWKFDINGHWHECKNCGDKHDEAAHISSGAATETEDEVCTVCGYVIAPKKEHTHNPILVEGKEATCTEEGQKAYYECEGCNKWFEDGTASIEITDKNSIIIPKKAHTPSAWIVDKEATEKDKGSQHKECIDCHTVLTTEEIPVITPQPDTQPNTNPDEQITTNPDEQSSTNPDEQTTTKPDEQSTTNPDDQSETKPEEQPTTKSTATDSEAPNNSNTSYSNSNSGAIQTGQASFAVLALIVLIFGVILAYAVNIKKHRN